MDDVEEVLARTQQVRSYGIKTERHVKQTAGICYQGRHKAPTEISAYKDLLVDNRTT